ncbi:hypothetical protein ACF3NA_03295 [Alkanindiges sp. WGS2144]|uniref:hypothetical protein n=1 Tax=Alkanindiges sp. WGS2144 TaxID=3366808 RepID=UPI00375069FE
MKIVLFDSILERHLPESLKRALEQLGHEVVYTDLLLLGHDMIQKESDIKFMWQQIEKVADAKPDLFVAFRPMNLTTEMLRFLRERMRTAIWLSDDPVLYKTCYAHVVNDYDIILHCGYADILRFYEAKGHPAGFNFPFWTDHHSFPVIYDPEKAQTDLIFLGNMHGQVRRKRYMELASLPFSKKIYGLLDSDPLGMHGGFLKEAYLYTERVSEVLATAKVGISIPQFFSEYSGLHYNFTELPDLGYFQFPSRVIQYAASGLPIVAVGDKRMQEVYPEIFVAETVSSLKPAIDRIVKDKDFALEVSRKTLLRFESSFSALSRAKMLIAVSNSLEQYQKLSVQERAHLFTNLAV